MPAGQLPFSQKLENGYSWPRFSPFKVTAEPASFVPSWARWNYSGYEGKDAYREYHDIVRTMGQVGEDEGCGRAFWEYEKELDRYGTPMALMLLPYWTDGCIGSMEGLYFEASATTPFHFLTQVELSTAPSAAQRDLPYGGFDIDKGVQHLQLLGVRYYMATSDNAIAQARNHPDLTEIARSGPWVVFEVADSALVTPLDHEPAVVTGIDDSQLHWVEEPHDESGRFGGPAIRWFTDPERWDVPLATSGPDDWQRVKASETPERVPVDDVRVTNIDEGDDSISFDVDQIGSPVLVKTSYFPNWSVSGAEGPYRVAPNLMVVVPTETHVELSYGRTGVEYLSYGLTLLGLAGLVLLIRHPRYGFSGRAARAAAEAGATDGVEPACGDAPEVGASDTGSTPGSTPGSMPTRPRVRATGTGTASPGTAASRRRASGSLPGRDRAAAPAGRAGAGADGRRHRAAGGVPPAVRLDPGGGRPGRDRRGEPRVLRAPPGGDVPERPLRPLGGDPAGVRRGGGPGRGGRRRRAPGPVRGHRASSRPPPWSRPSWWRWWRRAPSAWSATAGRCWAS